MPEPKNGGNDEVFNKTAIASAQPLTAVVAHVFSIVLVGRSETCHVAGMLSWRSSAAGKVHGASRDEPVNALWMVVAALCTFAISYRFHAAWLMATLKAMESVQRQRRFAAYVLQGMARLFTICTKNRDEKRETAPRKSMTNKDTASPNRGFKSIPTARPLKHVGDFDSGAMVHLVCLQRHLALTTGDTQE